MRREAGGAAERVRAGGLVLVSCLPVCLVLAGVPQGRRVLVLSGLVLAALVAAVASVARARRARSRGAARAGCWVVLGTAQAAGAVGVVLADLARSGELDPSVAGPGAWFAGASALLLTALALARLAPAAVGSRGRGELELAVIGISTALLAAAVAPQALDRAGSALTHDALVAVLAGAAMCAACGVALASRVASPGALPLRALVSLVAGAVLLACGQVLLPRSGAAGSSGAVVLVLASVLVGMAARAPVTERDTAAGSLWAERIGATATYLAVAPAVGVTLLLVSMGRPLPAGVAALAAALATAWLANSLLARFSAVGTVHALRTRVAAETLSHGMREKWFRSLVQNSSDAITVVDPDGRIRFHTPSASRILGHEPTSLVGSRFGGLLRAADADRLERALLGAAARPWSVTTVGFAVRRADGRWVDTETTLTSLVGDPDIRGIVLNTRDVSERRQLEQQLTRQAYSDTLTGLANRALLRLRVERALVAAEEEPGSVGVLFLDLNGFKSVNDTLGHAAGDELLRHVAQRLRRCVRPDDLVARLGGDEFAILVTGPGCEQAAVWIAGRVRRALSEQFVLQDRPVQVSTSTGIAVTESGEETADQILRNADLAMYRAKADRDLGYVLFEQTMHEALLERVKVESDLRQAIVRGDLALLYQPVVDMRSGEIVGAEALVRWNHPERGLVEPAGFIDVAEESGLVSDIGAWVLDEACHQGRLWQEFAGSGSVFDIAVNVSARQLSPALVTSVEETLARSGLPADALTLEVTESTLMGQQDTAQLLHRLKVVGVRVAIDDFGTGYSSLSYLSRFPVDVLKIDRSFVADVDAEAGPGGQGRGALAHTIVHLGRALSLVTVAEGIETEHQRQTLASMGCQLGQGFLFSEPVPAEQFELLLTGTAGRRDVPA